MAELVRQFDVSNLTWNGPIGVSPSTYLQTATLGVLTANEQQYLAPYVQQWSLTVGQELGKSTGIEITYLGSKTTHLEDQVDINQAAPLLFLFSRAYPTQMGRLYGMSLAAMRITTR